MYLAWIFVGLSMAAALALLETYRRLGRRHRRERRRESPHAVAIAAGGLAGVLAILLLVVGAFLQGGVLPGGGRFHPERELSLAPLLDPSRVARPPYLPVVLWLGLLGMVAAAVRIFADPHERAQWLRTVMIGVVLLIIVVLCAFFVSSCQTLMYDLRRDFRWS